MGTTQSLGIDIVGADKTKGPSCQGAPSKLS